jgi:murein DD-endopeptidase MepM/ murein hydrolase activator NlpD
VSGGFPSAGGSPGGGERSARSRGSWLAALRETCRLSLAALVFCLLLGRLGPVAAAGVAARAAVRVPSIAGPVDVTTEDASRAPLAPEQVRSLGIGTRAVARDLMYWTADPEIVSAARGGRSPTRLLWPVDGAHFGRGFGLTRVTRPDLMHYGVDMNAPAGTIVRAAADGIVAYAGDQISGFGNFVVLVHANGWVTSYAHNARMTVSPGDRVRRGDRIALVGSTGLAHGPHVHFELYVRGNASDPTPLFDGGPTIVQRIAEHAAARGEVPPPAPVSAEDRADPGALLLAVE